LRHQDKRATNEIITQLVAAQRQMKREKNIDKNNYDSDDSENEQNSPDGKLLNFQV
jgi:hypothetical protein